MTTNPEIKAARQYVTMAETSHPIELDWAEEVMLGHTTYSRRRYPSTFYVWADCSVLCGKTGKAWRCDPWPSAQYPRAVLLAQLIRAKVNNPALTIASEYLPNTAPMAVAGPIERAARAGGSSQLIGFDGGDGIG